jgi:hypothetical protein
MPGALILLQLSVPEEVRRGEQKRSDERREVGERGRHAQLTGPAEEQGRREVGDGDKKASSVIQSPLDLTVDRDPGKLEADDVRRI